MPGGYVPLALRPGWVLERYYGWSVVEQDRRCKILRRRTGPAVRHLILTDGLAEEGLDALARDLRVFHPLGITSLNDFSAPGDEPLRSVAGRRLRRVDGRRWFGVGTFVHDLAEDDATLWGRIAPRERTKCSSALRTGVRVELADRPSEDELRTFLELYDRMVAERNLDVLRLETLQAMARSGCLTLARGVGADGRTLVANVIHRSHDHGYFLFGARVADVPPGAGHLVHWEIIRKLKADGYRFYDLGLVASRDPEDGIHRFKRSLGGTFVSSGTEFKWVSPVVAPMVKLFERRRIADAPR